MSTPSEKVVDNKNEKRDLSQNDSELIAINKDLYDTCSSNWKNIIEERIKGKTRIISKVNNRNKKIFNNVFIQRLSNFKIFIKARKHDQVVNANQLNDIIGNFFFPLIKPYDMYN